MLKEVQEVFDLLEDIKRLNEKIMLIKVYNNKISILTDKKIYNELLSPLINKSKLIIDLINDKYTAILS